jgi:toxin YoeB
MRKVVFVEEAIEELSSFKYSNPKLAYKVFELILDIQKTPFSGLGKPEPLKGNLNGFWSRRITDEHRLTYKVTETSIEIIGCSSHYQQF